MSTYADTSFLFSYYAADVFSARSDAWLTANPLSLCFTEFNELELQNALSLVVFRRRMNAAQAQTVWQEIQTDVDIGWLVATSVSWPRVFRTATELAANFSPDLGTRSLDVLHVAVALVAGAKEFLTYDLRQGRLAAAAGLNVLP